MLKLRRNWPESDDMFDWTEEDECDITGECTGCGKCPDYDKYDNYTENNVVQMLAHSLPDDMPAIFESRLTENQISIRAGINVPDWMLLDPLKDGGFHFGKVNLWDKRYVGKPQNADGHILIIGGPGSGKTSSLIVPTLGTWHGHIVIIDVKPKGDLLARCHLTGKRVLVFNPHKKDASGFDPFAFLHSDGKDNLARNAKELALALIAMLPETKNDPVWIKSAQNLLAGVIVHHVDLGSTFNEAMTDIQLSSVKSLIKVIKEDGSKTAQMFVSKLKGLKPETLAGIGMDLTDLAILAADPFIGLALSSEGKENVINWHDLNTVTTPSIIVLQLPEENLDTWEPMTKLLINQLIRTLQRRQDKYSTEGNTLPPVLVMLEEFASLGRITSIKSGLTTLRSRGVTFCLVIQEISQLDDLYGTAGRKTILGTCSYKAILNVTEPESQEYCSKLIGSLIVPSRSVSTSYKSTGEAESYTLQVNEAREPIIFPHELAILNNIILMTPEGYCRVKKVPYYEPTEDPIVLPEPSESSKSDTRRNMLAIYD